MSIEVYKDGNRIGKDTVRVHRGGNRIDGISHDNELFFTDLPKPNRSKINLSFDLKTSLFMGELVPILSQECVPGDTFHIAQAHNLLLAPLIAPMYQRLDYRTWYFFVPTRLVDDTWKDFITYKNTNYTLPYFTMKQIVDTLGASYLAPNSLFDYFGLPVQVSSAASNERHLLAHKFRCYNLIWNEYFRDEFKQTEIPIFKTGGNITSSEIDTYALPHRIGWEKDYFTTCQTSPQTGADVDIPVSVSGTGSVSGITIESDSFMKFAKQDGSDPVSGNTKMYNEPYSDQFLDSDNNNLYYKSGLKATGTGIISGLTTVGTINDLRMANHLQRYRDRLQIAGQRYNEQILAEFGVVVPDYRIQRPEYIGGYASPVTIGKVNQTTPTASSPLGSFAGQAGGEGRMNYIHYDCKEHGYIVGLSCVVPRSCYYQGIPRDLLKNDIFDYYHPEFATLGDQQVYKDEIYCQTGNSTARFGYQQRYAEYKYAQDRVCGDFRDSMDFWHMGRKFASTPALNSDFVECEPTDRVFAVQQDDVPNVYAEIYQQIDSVRPMPISVVPNLENE